MTRSNRLMRWVVRNLNADGLIDRWDVARKGLEFDLPSTNHLYASRTPMMEAVGERMARPTERGQRYGR